SLVRRRIQGRGQKRVVGRINHPRKPYPTPVTLTFIGFESGAIQSVGACPEQQEFAAAIRASNWLADRFPNLHGVASIDHCVLMVPRKRIPTTPKTDDCMQLEACNTNYICFLFCYNPILLCS